MIEKAYSALRSLSVTKVANIVNWILVPPVLIGVVLEGFLHIKGTFFHPIPLLSFAALSFSYALLLSADINDELLQGTGVLERTPRWAKRWVCLGWGMVMLAINFFMI